MNHGILEAITISIIAATTLGIVARFLKQPLILAYLLAGVAIGPDIGLGLVHDKESIHTISEIGLILLLFIIGLEMDVKKIRESGKTLVTVGILQFLFCVMYGLLFANVMGFPWGNGRFDAVYLAVGMALSSTLIVVKLLHDKFEVLTVTGGITVGILIFQDIWAILFLALQPALENPSPTILLISFGKGIGLIGASLLISKYILPRLFRSIARAPELLLITGISWCFVVAGTAQLIDLSPEMGALIAGVSLSTFPYNIDVIAKVANIRDFFVTLFFVGLGMQIPLPDFDLIATALLCSLVLIASRFFSIFPVLFASKAGLRTSLISSINLAQMSEFSLVIAAIGLTLNHLDNRLIGLMTFIFAITSVASTYMISYNHELQKPMGRLLRKIGFRDVGAADEEIHKHDVGLVFLGFFRYASSILYEIESKRGNPKVDKVIDQMMVVDFNPEAHKQLNGRGVHCVYGDISSMETLHHAHLESAKLVVVTITDSVLRGTKNLALFQGVKKIAPDAQVVLASDTIAGAIAMYEAGAAFVCLPRMHSAAYLSRILLRGLEHGFEAIKEFELRRLRSRQEILA